VYLRRPDRLSGPRGAMGDDRDDLEMPLMPRRDDGGGGGGRKASVVVTVVPRDGFAYGASSSLRLVKQPSRPPSSCSSADGRTSNDRKKSSANGGFAIKSPSKSAHSSVSGKTSAQVRGSSWSLRNRFTGEPPFPIHISNSIAELKRHFRCRGSIAVNGGSSIITRYRFFF